MYRHAKPVELCQCYTEGVALADAHGSSDFFGDDNASEVVNTAYNSCGFHMEKVYTLILFFSFHHDIMSCSDILTNNETSCKKEDDYGRKNF